MILCDPGLWDAVWYIAISNQHSLTGNGGGYMDSAKNQYNRSNCNNYNNNSYNNQNQQQSNNYQKHHNGVFPKNKMK